MPSSAAYGGGWPKSSISKLFQSSGAPVGNRLIHSRLTGIAFPVVCTLSADSRLSVWLPTVPCGGTG